MSWIRPWKRLASVHVCMVGPINISDLADLLPADQRGVAQEQRRGPATAPGAIVRGHHARGHHVSVVTRTPYAGPLVLRGHRIDIVRVDGTASRLSDMLTRWSGAVSSMRAAIRDLAPDVIHANWAYEAALAAASSGLPYITTARDAPLTVVRYYPRPDRWVRLTMPYELRLRHGRSVVTAVSPYLAEAWKAQTRWHETPTVIPNIAPPPDRREPVENAGAPTFVEVADAGGRKNVRTLLRAFALVRAARPDVRLALLGGGLSASGELAAWAARTGLHHGVEFAGVRGAEEVRQRMRSAVAHVHLAREETFGNTLVEAMSMGTAVIAGAHSGSVPWVLGTEYSANLVDVESPAEVSVAMMSMLENPAERRRLGSVGLDEVTSRFSSASVCERYEATYRRAVESPGTKLAANAGPRRGLVP
jgi:glycosyltransferase involved in cell wall biosynthesis